MAAHRAIRAFNRHVRYVVGSDCVLYRSNDEPRHVYFELIKRDHCFTWIPRGYCLPWMRSADDMEMLVLEGSGDGVLTYNFVPGPTHVLQREYTLQIPAHAWFSLRATSDLLVIGPSKIAVECCNIHQADLEPLGGSTETRRLALLASVEETGVHTIIIEELHI